MFNMPLQVTVGREGKGKIAQSDQGIDAIEWKKIQWYTLMA